MPIVQVAVFAPLWELLDYQCESEILPGSRLQVPLGKRQVVAVAVAMLTTSAWENLKPITAVLDAAPVFSEDSLALAQWLSRYYHAPLGMVFAAMLPTVLRKSPKTSVQKATKTLPKDLPLYQCKGQRHRNLYPEQAEAVAAVSVALGRFQPFLLHGVTGSGKTEVYLALAEQVLAKGQQVLWLVPEIGLVAAMADRLVLALSARLGLWHSALTERQREYLWQQAAAQTVDVMVGTRSAVFLPLARLGLIVVDEEHDQSYKQDTLPFYHGRDVAIYRASRAQIPIVLGTATPALETLYKVQLGAYHPLYLTTRAHGTALPQVKLVDVRSQRLQQGLSPALLQAIRESLFLGKQALLFLNRRGFSPVYFCHDCGWKALCPACERPLVYHKEQKHLACHPCGRQFPLPKHCPDCQSSNLVAVGLGTEQLTEALQTEFPEEKVLRVDSDNTQSKHALKAFLRDIAEHKASLLVGTQMLSKGHDFPHLHLVGVVNADSALLSLDFRAVEHFAQQLTQVAGRPGRREDRGLVVIQTHFPEHPELQLLLQQGYAACAQELLAQRQAADLPPFRGLIVVEARSKNAERAEASLQRLCDWLAADFPEVEVVGPMPAVVAKIQIYWRFHLWLLAPRAHLQALLAAGRQQKQWEPPSGVHWRIDVDAQQVL
jgi:primosomal protein N' (replication factor Y)